MIARGRWKRLGLATGSPRRAGQGELVALADGVAGLSSSVGYAGDAARPCFQEPPFWFGYAWFVGSGPRRFTRRDAFARLGLLHWKQPLGKLLDAGPAAGSPSCVWR